VCYIVNYTSYYTTMFECKIQLESSPLVVALERRNNGRDRLGYLQVNRSVWCLSRSAAEGFSNPKEFVL